MDNDLKKSHSKFSNAKLTLLCLFSAISFSFTWIGLGLINNIDNNVAYLLAGIGAFATFISIVLIINFRR